ncbi:hypothetical protein HOG98_03515 [bacterium]|jgi:hypothetical protein|nr:hypothetical protein [bacterium]
MQLKLISSSQIKESLIKSKKDEIRSSISGWVNSLIHPCSSSRIPNTVIPYKPLTFTCINKQITRELENNNASRECKELFNDFLTSLTEKESISLTSRFAQKNTNIQLSHLINQISKEENTLPHHKLLIVLTCLGEKTRLGHISYYPLYKNQLLFQRFNLTPEHVLYSKESHNIAHYHHMPNFPNKAKVFLSVPNSQFLESFYVQAILSKNGNQCSLISTIERCQTFFESHKKYDMHRVIPSLIKGLNTLKFDVFRCKVDLYLNNSIFQLLNSIQAEKSKLMPINQAVMDIIFSGIENPIGTFDPSNKKNKKIFDSYNVAPRIIKVLETLDREKQPYFAFPSDNVELLVFDSFYGTCSHGNENCSLHKVMFLQASSKAKTSRFEEKFKGVSHYVQPVIAEKYNSKETWQLLQKIPNRNVLINGEAISGADALTYVNILENIYTINKTEPDTKVAIGALALDLIGQLIQRFLWMAFHQKFYGGMDLEKVNVTPEGFLQLSDFSHSTVHHKIYLKPDERPRYTEQFLYCGSQIHSLHYELRSLGNSINTIINKCYSSLSDNDYKQLILLKNELSTMVIYHGYEFNLTDYDYPKFIDILKNGTKNGPWKILSDEERMNHISFVESILK